MPYNIFGEWIPEKENETPKQPVKVRLVKRGNNVLTVIHNVPKASNEAEELASFIKKKTGAGGCVKEDTIEIQGDKVKLIEKILLEKGIRSS